MARKKHKNAIGRLAVLLGRLAVAALMLPLLVLLIANQIIRISSDGYLYDDLLFVPHNPVGLVLGTSHRVQGGGPNPYFHKRMEAAARLYHEGKVNYLIASGDNQTQWYNEPEQMRRELVRLGVPDSIIHLDFAGLRTFDSVIRCHRIYGQTSFTIISQRFHNQRAVYIARQYGLEAVAFNAGDADQGNHPSLVVREWFAKANVFLDMLLNRQPGELGEQVPIGE